MCVCHYMKKSIFQLLNICMGALGVVSIAFCAYCYGKLNTFNILLYTLLSNGIILSAFSINVCTNDFRSKCLLKLYLVLLCVTFSVETALVVSYMDVDTQKWLLDQLPHNIQNLLDQNIHVAGIISLSIAAAILIMFALGVELIYHSNRHQVTGRSAPGPNTYLLADSDINNLIGSENRREYKMVETRDQGSQYHRGPGRNRCER